MSINTFVRIKLKSKLNLSAGNAFGCNINESVLLDTAHAMANYGLRDLGYNYVVLDDCWSSGRNSSGYLVEDTTKFPNVSYTFRLNIPMLNALGDGTRSRSNSFLGHEIRHVF